MPHEVNEDVEHLRLDMHVHAVAAKLAPLAWISQSPNTNTMGGSGENPDGPRQISSVPSGRRSTVVAL